MSLRILVLGGGGREHALVWKLEQSGLVNQIYVCPGNGGTQLSPKVTNVNLEDTSFQNLVKWAVTNDVSMHDFRFVSFCLLRHLLRSISSFQVQNNPWLKGLSLISAKVSCLPRVSTLFYSSHFNSRNPCIWPNRSRSSYGRVQGFLKGVYDPSCHTHCCLSCVCFITSRPGNRVCQNVWSQGCAES